MGQQFFGKVLSQQEYMKGIKLLALHLGGKKNAAHFLSAKLTLLCSQQGIKTVFPISALLRQLSGGVYWENWAWSSQRIVLPRSLFRGQEEKGCKPVLSQ